ncbi:MAG: bifunctional DNA primase/polymerase [Verrucomicrobiae bacterium]|nr:bifunctional DNA primase/polymerase [Verrucomicrobiae bacterium]
MFEYAAELEKFGLKTFPLARNSKVPSKGYKWMQMVEEPHAARFAGLVGYNLAIATGKASGVIAVDLDHGATEQDLALFPRTWRVRSRDGYHIYFKYTPRMKKGIQPLFGGTTNAATAHVRSNGHYFVAPPSVVSWCEKTKQALDPWEYRWDADAGGELRPGECELADVPEWMLRCFDHEKPFEEVPDEDDVPAGSTDQRAVVEGLRHGKLVSRGRSLWDRCGSSDAVRQELVALNQTFLPPIEEKRLLPEIDNLIGWLEKRVGKPGQKLVESVPVVASEQRQGPKGYEHCKTVEDGVFPLGYNGRKYYFISRSNYAILALGSTALLSSSLCELMPACFWAFFFPKRDKNGVALLDAANWVEAGSYLMEECRKKGVFNEASAARGSGVWVTPKHGVAYHRGDRVVIQGESLHLLEATRDGLVYTRDRVLPEITSHELTAEEGRKLVSACNTLDWRAPKSAAILAGWIATAPMCGALRKRPHIELIAPPGVGKTDFVSAVVDRIFGRRAITKRGSETTEAGIRQQMSMAALPVVCDDIELSEENDQANARIEKVVVLARSAYDATPENLITKGTTDGEGKQFRCVSSFMFCAVASPLREPQDRARFISLLAKRVKDPALQAEQHRRALAAYSAIDEGFGDRLFTRMLLRWDQFQANINVVERALSGKCPGRLAQNLAVVLAGTATITHDAALSLEQAIELTADIHFQQLCRAEVETLEEKCLNSVLSHRIQITHKDTLGRIDRTTTCTVEQAIGMVLGGELDADGGVVERGDLQSNGLDVTKGALYVRVENPQIRRQLPRNQAAQFGALLALIPNAEQTKHRFGDRNCSRVAAVRIPLTSFADSGADYPAGTTAAL